MAVTKRELGTIMILYLVGEFWGDTETDELQQAIAATDASGNKRLIFNLRDCTKMNSIAGNVLASAKRNYDAKGGRVLLCDMNARLHTLLTTSGLIIKRGLEYVSSEEEAIAAFAEGSNGS